jgi:hypothetical protein
MFDSRIRRKRRQALTYLLKLEETKREHSTRTLPDTISKVLFLADALAMSDHSHVLTSF